MAKLASGMDDYFKNGNAWLCRSQALPDIPELLFPDIKIC
jgi:hypothetical protein